MAIAGVGSDVMSRYVWFHQKSKEVSSDLLKAVLTKQDEAQSKLSLQD
jgi:hypothetical protein